MTSTATQHILKARRVQFDFSDTPARWLPDDPFASHMINGIHLLLPADVRGFIHQEAVHARAHQTAQTYLTRHGFHGEDFLKRAHWLFEQLLGDRPLGIDTRRSEALSHRWLVTRVGLIAAIEHFTGLLGQWAIDNTSWEASGDPAMVDLFKWHLAEEVEHRTVAFERYEHLCKTRPGFYLGRQALMAIVFPLFIHFLADGYRSLARQDRTDADSRRLARRCIVRLLLEVERVGRRTGNVPTFSFLVAGALRWISPSFHPVGEGNTEQALAYLARSPAARAAEARIVA